MAPIDGAIGMKININHPQTTDVNISKAQPSKASGLGGVRFLRSKSAPILYKYKLKTPVLRTEGRGLGVIRDCPEIISSRANSR